MTEGLSQPMQAKPTSEKKLREQAVDWLIRLQDNPGDEAVEAAFQAWISADSSRSLVYERAKRLMGDASHLLSSDIDFTRNAAKHALPRARTVIGAILVLGLCSSAFYLADGPMRLRADVMSKVGEPQTVTFADGSTVELNANSAIAVDLTSNERRIRLLRGEAYFHVAADRSRPFVVEAGNGTTTALGTAFDVNLMADETRVVVTEHAVVVSPLDDEAKLQVSERQQLSYDGYGRLGAVEDIDPDMAIAWRQGRLAFDNRPLSAVVEEIARYIPGKIVIAQATLAEKRVSGSLDLTAPNETLDGFANAFRIRITRVGPYLTVLSE
ncbi:FecR family protein [Rhizobium sp. S152]|uniref:FecR family protein n=1 Tax=Rhizobium sp. S152 TaxID=3055038 RepID=UPI0025A94EC2|nr:FecR family protein [Rhizobium sp. S152]MDM9625330.1 FecR family protein [Rhizobium sp. S152]